MRVDSVDHGRSLIVMEQIDPPIDPVVDPVPTPLAPEPITDIRSRAQKACDALPACDTTWCDISGCELPCELLEVLHVVDCDPGCL